MRVARASSGPKIPRRKRGCIYEMGYLVGWRKQSLFARQKTRTVAKENHEILSTSVDDGIEETEPIIIGHQKHAPILAQAAS